MRIRNVSGDDRYVAELAAVIAAGAVVDVDDDVAARLIDQVEVWQPADAGGKDD